MLRHHVAGDSDAAVRLLYSARSLDEVLYRHELESLMSDHGIGVHVALTRAWPEDWADIAGASGPSCSAMCHGRPVSIL
jgi:Na+-transporting NADH:ubiquinone oxidoreductase subunit NqrF